MAAVVFRHWRGGSNFRWKGTLPPTIIGIRKQECFCYLTVKTTWSYLHSSGNNTRKWQTDVALQRSALQATQSAVKTDDVTCKIPVNVVFPFHASQPIVCNTTMFTCMSQQNENMVRLQNSHLTPAWYMFFYWLISHIKLRSIFMSAVVQ